MSRDSLIIELSEAGYREVAPRDIYGKTSELMSGEVSYDGGYMEASPTEMFGQESTLGSSTMVEPLKPTLISEPLFQSLVIGGIIAYLFVIYRFWNFIGHIWQGVVTRRSERSIRDEGGELPFERFKITVMALGLVLLSLVAVRLVDMSLAGVSSIYDSGVAAMIPLYAIVAIVVMFVWQYIFHRLVQWVTRSDIMSAAGAVSLLNLVRCVVLLFPLIAIWLVAPVDMLSLWSIVLCVLMAVMTFIYLKETFVLFIGQKISILHWFLYLCTAILLPISFLMTVVSTHMA